MMRRWICPNCGTGVHAPSRPRKDDVRRFCLECSAKTGRLVGRVCPALDKKRASRATRRASARKVRLALEAQRERERLEAHGISLIDLFDKVRHFEAWEGYFQRSGMPTIKIRRCAAEPLSQLGSVWPWDDRITVAAWLDQEPADFVETFLHELAHLATFKDSGPNERTEWHSDAWRCSLFDAVRTLTGIEPVADAPDIVSLDLACVDALRTVYPSPVAR